MDSSEQLENKRKRDEEEDDIVTPSSPRDESDEGEFEIPKEHLKLAKRREKVLKPAAVIQKAQNRTSISDVRNVILWVLSDSQGMMPKWCMIKNKNLVSSITVIITPFIDRHTLFEHAGPVTPFFSSCIRGSMIPMTSVSSHRYPTVCPVLSTFLSSPASNKTPQWVSHISDNEDDKPIEVSRSPIAHFLMSEETRRANDIPEPLLTGMVPPGFVSTKGKKTRVFPQVEEGEYLPSMLRHATELEWMVKDPDYPNLVGIDCEMVDTVAGKELARVSLIDHLGRVLYDSVVLPENEITDYITQYSGITPKMIRECRTSFKEAQKQLLSFLDESSILVGHAIDNDLRCLRLLHDRIIDTSDIFPHPNGHPSKHSLVFLLSRVLRESLDREGGHDSVDDARATLKVAMKKFARGWDYSPAGMGTSTYHPLATLIEGRAVLHAELENADRYKLDNLDVNPESFDDAKLRIHLVKDYQLACETNESRIEALKSADEKVRKIVSSLDQDHLVVVFSGCGDIHAFKKFERLADKCDDETQRVDLTKALQRAKDKAVSAFAIISTVADLPVHAKTCTSANIAPS